MNLGRRTIASCVLTLVAGLASVPAAGSAGARDSTTNPGDGGGSTCHVTKTGIPCPRGCWSSGTHGEVHGDFIYFYKYTGRDGYWYHYDVAMPIYPNPAVLVARATKYCGPN